MAFLIKTHIFVSLSMSHETVIPIQQTEYNLCHRENGEWTKNCSLLFISQFLYCCLLDCTGYSKKSEGKCLVI